MSRNAAFCAVMRWAARVSHRGSWSGERDLLVAGCGGPETSGHHSEPLSPDPGDSQSGKPELLVKLPNRTAVPPAFELAAHVIDLLQAQCAVTALPGGGVG